jgi:RNA polymerase sigma-70 factor (ECF subfamily)
VATPDPDLARQREIVDASFAAAHRGDFDRLMAVLDPNVVIRSDGGVERPALTQVRRGAAEVARGAIKFALPHAVRRPALVNGAAGVVVFINGRPYAVMGFTVACDKIVAIDCLVDPQRVARLDLPSS